MHEYSESTNLAGRFLQMVFGASKCFHVLSWSKTGLHMSPQCSWLIPAMPQASGAVHGSVANSDPDPPCTEATQRSSRHVQGQIKRRHEPFWGTEDPSPSGVFLNRGATPFSVLLRLGELQEPSMAIEPSQAVIEERTSLHPPDRVCRVNLSQSDGTATGYASLAGADCQDCLAHFHLIRDLRP